MTEKDLAPDKQENVETRVQAALEETVMPPAQPLEAVSLAFTYTRDEYLRAARQYLFASKTITWRNIALVGLLFIFGLVYGLISRFNSGSIVLLALSIIVLGLGCALYFYIPARNYAKTEKYRQAYHLDFEEGGIHFTTPSIDSRLGWETYTDAWENADFFYLVTGPQAYTVVPKRAFTGEAQLAAFRKLMAARVQPVKPV